MHVCVCFGASSLFSGSIVSCLRLFNYIVMFFDYVLCFFHHDCPFVFTKVPVSRFVTSRHGSPIRSVF